MRFTAGNILKMLGMATEAEWNDGFTWYERAYAECVLISRETNVPVYSVIGVMAAMSPQKNWDENIRLTRESCLLRRGIGQVGRQCDKATRIIRGEDWRSTLTGPKERAFAECIRGSRSEVVLDRHAYDVAVGEVTNDKARKVLSREDTREAIAEVYREVAVGMNLLPHQVQAITWVVWRNRKVGA